MAYFDLTSMEDVDRKTSSVLGYKKIFNKKEIAVVESLDHNGKCIVKSGESGFLSRALRRNNVLGILIKDNELIRLAVEEAVTTEKLLCLSVHDITCVDTRTRMRNIYRMKGLISFAMRSKARIALVTLAQDESCLLSSNQMIEIAKFLGANESQAEKMISNLGETQ